MNLFDALLGGSPRWFPGWYTRTRAAWLAPSRTSLIQRVVSTLPEHASVLELDGASGEWALELAAIRPGVQVDVEDDSDHLLLHGEDLARKAHCAKRVRFHLPEDAPDRRYDAVVRAFPVHTTAMELVQRLERAYDALEPGASFWWADVLAHTADEAALTVQKARSLNMVPSWLPGGAVRALGRRLRKGLPTRASLHDAVRESRFGLPRDEERLPLLLPYAAVPDGLLLLRLQRPAIEV